MNTNIKPKISNHTFRSLNLQKADYAKINSHLESIDWDVLISMCTPDEFPELLRLTILQVCTIYAPLKSEQSNKVNPFLRNRNTLRRRKRKIKPQIEGIKAKNPTSQKLTRLLAELYEIDQKIKESVNSQRKEKERKAVIKIINNPRYFYSYCKKFRKQQTSVGPLLNHKGDLEHDPKKMADILKDQYSSVFSDPSCPKKKPPNIKATINNTLENITFCCDDIIKAINEINENSACGDEDIPAVILKQCKTSLAYPILKIWEESLHRGYVPKTFKKQIITPVHKKSSKAEPANYRPIALTSHLIKIFERILRNHIVHHLESNNLICNNQHGFRKHRSCLTQLLTHIDIILQNFLNNQETDVIYLDYAKAFDKVDHQLLLKKLHAYGIRGKLLMWLNSYLTNRWQTVVINGQHSLPAKVISGVPQGTVLGPVLFILYLNDLECCIQHSIISSFADDTRLKRAINTEQDTSFLQSDLDNSITWSEANNMKLHQNKFELVIHSTGNTKLLEELPYSHEFREYHTKDSSTITPSDSVTDLGIRITPDISWSPHISDISEDCRKMVSWILSVFSDRSTETMVPLFRTLVRSRTEYCCPLWNTSKLEDIKRLEAVQRTFTAKIAEVKHLSYWDRLKSLKLMSLQRRRERYVIIHVYKILHDLAPNDIGLQFYETSRRGVCCKVPPLVKSSKQQYQSKYDDSFHVFGAKLFNLVPKNIKKKKSLNSFKASLTRFILLPPDHPPVPGIASENSLLQLLAKQQAPWREHCDYTTTGGRVQPSEEYSDEDSEEDRHPMA